jgi:hypothetical protein
MTMIVRSLIDDYDDGVTATIYTDDRLESTILISAQLVIFDVKFDKAYTIDVDTCVLAPDPTAATKDNAFINLVSLKTACLILGGEAKAAATGAMKVKDGGRFGVSEIDTGQAYKALNERANQSCKDYQDAKTQYLAGDGAAGEAILGPYTNEFTRPHPGNFS